MTAKTLKTGWKMRSLKEDSWVPAKVPGSVYQAYLDAGKMEDPFYRANEEKALNLMKQDFEFATTFDAEESLQTGRCFILTVSILWGRSISMEPISGIRKTCTGSGNLT